MNELIKELVTKAFDTADYPSEQQYRIEPNSAFCAKFAELVLAEISEGIFGEPHEDGEKFTPSEIQKMIKAHFGDTHV